MVQWTPQLPEPLSAIRRYGLAVLSVALTLGVALFVGRYNVRGVEFPLFLFAIAATVWYAGPGPAVLTLVLSSLAFNYFFTEPFHTLYVTQSDLPYYIVFVLFASLLAWFSAVRRRVERELLQSRDALAKEVAERTQQARDIRALNDALAQRTTELEAINKELEAFAYSISHDLRAPVRHIIGFTELLQKGAASVLTERSQRHVTMILESAKRMGTLIDDLFAFSRIGRAETHKSMVSLQQIVQEALSEVAQETEGRDIVWRVGALPAWYGDRAMLRLVLVVGHPATDDSGNFEFVGAVTDVTERNEALEEVKQRTHELAAANDELKKEVAERRRAEDALRESERESRLIVDTIPGLVAILTPAGEVDVVNNQLVEYCGQPLEEMKQWGTNGTVHVDDLPRVIRVFTQALTSGDPYDFEARIRRFDGAYRWFQVRGLPLRDAPGRITRWYVLLTDIDERKRAEETLAASERQFRLLVETIPALVWCGTPEGELDYLNQRAVEYLGHTAQSLSAGRWLELVHPDQRDATVRRWLHSATTGSSYDDVYQLRRADGQYRWIQSLGEPFRDTEGQIAYWYGQIVDIDDRKRAEAGLQQAYGHLAEAQRLSKTGSFITDLQADHRDWSEEAFRIFELDPTTSVTLQAIRGLVHPEDLPVYDAAYTRAMEGVGFDMAFRIITSVGHVKHLHAVGHVLEEIAGRPVFIGAIQDVTESKVAEEALNRARSELTHVARVTTLSTLTASIAHEVNQPLSGIITNASTCLRMLDATPPNVDGARETARRTIRDGNRASDVITRLRALFSRKEYSLEPLDLNEATREVIALSLSELQRNRVILQSELADDLQTIIGDRVQLQQVLLNLLRNASDAMVGVDDRPRHLLIKTERDGGDRVRVLVRDAGVGIDRQSMDKLFDAFFTTKSGGMGIGLSVSRSIVERHHGRLWAEPNDGPGATFSFSIPRGADTKVS